MPVLLESDKAPRLRELLEQANTLGLEFTVAQPEAAEGRVQGIGSLASAGPTELSFLANSRMRAQLHSTRAGWVLLRQDDFEALRQDELSFYAILCEEPYAMYAMLAQWFAAKRLEDLPTGIDPSATIHPEAVLGSNVSIGPYSVIEKGVRIGSGSRLGAHCMLGENTRLGEECLLHARVTLYHGVVVGDRAIIHSGAVLGADGFGFAPLPGGHAGWAKIAQLGGVRIGNDVEIGANTTIDRGALDDTVLEDGVKLDNQIMIAHNVRVGEHTAMAACVGVAGSTHIGARCTIGGAAMLSGHLTLGDDVHVSGATAITSDLSTPGRYTGVFPYASHRDWQKNAAVLTQLAALRRRIRDLEKAYIPEPDQDDDNKPA